VFTSGATEANRLGVLGRDGHPAVIAWSPRDHASVAAAAAELAGRGSRGVLLQTDRHGSVAAAAHAVADSVPAGGVAIVCLTSVCGQTGTVEPAVLSLAGDPRLTVHVDHTQAAAWDPTPLHRSAATTLALAPHKFGGPKGIGGLVIRGTTQLTGLQPGPQELGLRGGTESAPLAAAFAAALEAAVAEREACIQRVTTLRDRLERGVLEEAAAIGLRSLVVGHDASRAPHIATIAIEGIDRQTLVMAADLRGVCLATGTACASGSSEPAAAIVALGLPDWVARGAVRASLATTTTTHDIDEAVRRLSLVFRGVAGGGLQLGSAKR